MLLFILLMETYSGKISKRLSVDGDGDRAIRVLLHALCSGRGIYNHRIAFLPFSLGPGNPF